jgi:hypothetical protein
LNQDTQYSQQRPAQPFTDRNEVTKRLGTESYMRRQDSQPRITTPSNSEQVPSQVVRGAPSRGLKDMLVPSIEIERSSDAPAQLPQRNMRGTVYSGYEEELFPQQAGERRRLTPPTREVIVIDDTPPQIKRRRIVYEEDAGRFRPLPSYEPRFSSTAPDADSHLIPISSVRRDFLVHQPRTQSRSSQGLFRDVQPPLGGTSSEQRLPVYNARPEDSVYFDTDPARRTQPVLSHGQWGESRSVEREQPIPDPISSGPPEPRRFLAQNERSSELNRTRQHEPELEKGRRIQAHAPFTFPVEKRVTRYNEMGPFVATDLALTHNFSQSRTDNPVIRAGEGFPAARGSAHQVNAPYQYDGYTDRSSTTFHNTQERSPVRYMERPR